MQLKAPRVLFFITGAVPSAKDMADAIKYGTNVVFRDATKVADECLEECEGVAGAIPAKYKKAIADVKSEILHADDVMKAFFAKGVGFFHAGATASALEMQQMRDNVASEIRADLTGKFDSAMKTAQDTFNGIQAELQAKLDAATASLSAVNTDLTNALNAKYTVEQALSAAIAKLAALGNGTAAPQPDPQEAQPQTAAPLTPPTDPAAPAASQAAAGWTANVDPAKT